MVHHRPQSLVNLVFLILFIGQQKSLYLRLVFHICTCQLWGCFQGFQQIPTWDLCPTGKHPGKCFGSYFRALACSWEILNSLPCPPGCLYLSEPLATICTRMPTSQPISCVPVPVQLSSSIHPALTALRISCALELTGGFPTVTLQKRKSWHLCSLSEIILGSMTWASHPGSYVLRPWRKYREDTVSWDY